MWTQILSFIPQSDRLQHRLVNRAWRNLIDKCSTFKVSYNDVPPHLLNHVLGLRIRGCEFSGIRETPKPFLHPLLVREITLGACVTATNTKDILSCVKNVEYLRYFVTQKSDISFDPACVQHEGYLKNLKRLKSIEIGILYFGRSRSPTSVSTSVKTLLGNSNIVYAGITEIQFDFEITRSEWEIIYAFIKRHGETLCKFGLYRQCICEYDDHFTSDEGDIGVQDRLQAFKECKWKSVTVIKGASYKCRCSGELLWSHFLNDQSQLESLTTDLVPNGAVIFNLISNNRETLNKLSLQDVSLGVDAHLDFSIFQGCSKLQFLTLHFLSCAIIVMNVKIRAPTATWSADDKKKKCKPYTERFSECSGLQFLPKSLKYLSIKGCDTLSSTLLEMSLALTNLTDLVLGAPSGPPKRSGYGVTINVFLGFLQNMSKLTRLSIHRNFLNLTVEQESTLLLLIKDVFNINVEFQIGSGDIEAEDHDPSLETRPEFLELHLSETSRQSLIERIISEFQLR